jgi:hypothetical protein
MCPSARELATGTGAPPPGRRQGVYAGGYVIGSAAYVNSPGDYVT